MSEQLVVRLGSDSNQAVHWLVWSTTEREIIASGVLNNASALSELTVRAGSRAVIALVPSSDISFRQVELPGRLTKQMLNALPYMLEQELSSDIDKLHFAVVDKSANQVMVAILSHDKMQMWQGWLEQAELQCQQFIPDVLTLPLAQEGWSAVQLADQWLIRQGKAQGLCIESALLPWVLMGADTDANSAASTAPQLITSYSDITDMTGANWQQAELELPLQLCAQGAIANSINLLQGRYKIAPVENVAWRLWRGTALVAGLAAVMIFTHQFIELKQLQQQQAALDNDIKQVYKTVFKPKTMRLNSRLVKKQMQSRLAQLQGGGGDSGFLVTLSQLASAFQQAPSIKPVTMRYDSKQGSLRILANASDFQAFDQFKTTIATRFNVTQGTLSQKLGSVQGTLDIKGK